MGEILLTLIEMSCLVYVVCAGLLSFTPVKIQVVAYVILLVITLSEQSYASRIRMPFLSLLGQISMSLFIWHYVVGRIILHLVRGVSIPWLIVAFLAGSFAVAFASYYIIEIIKKRGISARKIFLKS